MSINSEMTGRDVKIRYKHGDGKSVVREHRVWDLDRFLRARIEEGVSARDKADKFVIELVSK